MYGCSNQSSASIEEGWTWEERVVMHSFPKDSDVRDSWMRFVALTRKDVKAYNPDYASICNKHFKDEDYLNKMEFMFSPSNRYELNNDFVTCNASLCVCMKNSKLII